VAARLSAQDKKFEARFNVIDRRFDAIDRRFDAVDKRFDKLEQRFLQKLNSLTNTLDHFLKRLMDTAEEFVLLKHDVNRIKAVLREKLGVSLD
jgi:DNA anti-recombination protein RmuC